MIDIPDGITIPKWANYIAKDMDGETCAYEDRPLWKLPYQFWKCQLGRDKFLFKSDPYECDYNEEGRIVEL